MNPNNKLDRERLIKATENATILPHFATTEQGKWDGPLLVGSWLVWLRLTRLPKRAVWFLSENR